MNLSIDMSYCLLDFCIEDGGALELIIDIKHCFCRD